MSHQITISQNLVYWAGELDRYYYGDLKDMDQGEWLKAVDRLNAKIANELRRHIFEQVPHAAVGAAS